MYNLNYVNIIKSQNYKNFINIWYAPIFLLSSLFLLGSVGYRLTEGWDWGDCLWMVLITITTIGFGEVEVLSASGRIVTFLIIGGGLFVVQLTLQRFIQLSELGYFHKVEELRLNRLIRRMKNHVILCGFGRTGKEIAAQLKLENIPTLIIEQDSNRKYDAENLGFNILLGDATLDETLIMAGIKKCRSLVVTLQNDAANLYVVLSAKGLNKECRLIARAATEEASNKLKLAGASTVVSPYVAAGRTMAASALRPIAVDFMDLLAGSDSEIEEIRLTNNVAEITSFETNSLNKKDFRRSGGALLIAIKTTEGLISNPGREINLRPDSVLVYLGSKEQLQNIRDLFKPILKEG